MRCWWLAVLLLSGCAFGLSGPDPDAPRSQMPKCDTGKGLVALDGAMAATSGVVAISLAGDSEPALALLPLSIGAIYLAGAVRGNSNVNKCRKATGEYETYMAGRETMPGDEPATTPIAIADRPTTPPMRMRQPIPDDEPPAMTTPAPQPAVQGTVAPPAPVAVAPAAPQAPVAGPPQAPPPRAPAKAAPQPKPA